MEKRRGVPKTLRRTNDEQFMLTHYHKIDEIIEKYITRMKDEEGCVPPCGLGCFHCCRQPFELTPPECHVVAQHLKRNLSIQARDTVRARSKAWVEWRIERLGQLHKIFCLY